MRNYSSSPPSNTLHLQTCQIQKERNKKITPHLLVSLKREIYCNTDSLTHSLGLSRQYFKEGTYKRRKCNFYEEGEICDFQRMLHAFTWISKRTMPEKSLPCVAWTYCPHAKGAGMVTTVLPKCSG